MNHTDCQSVCFEKKIVPLLLWQQKITEFHRISVNNTCTSPAITNTYKRTLTEESYTKGVRFPKKERWCRNEKTNLLFIIKNTHKDILVGIFGILKNCWVYQQKWWMSQTHPSYGSCILEFCLIYIRPLFFVISRFNFFISDNTLNIDECSFIVAEFKLWN